MEIKSLKGNVEKMPPIWTMFTDATGGLSYFRIIGSLTVIVFLGLCVFAAIKTGNLPVPSQEWTYIIVSLALGKSVQRFAEQREVDSQLNYDFQMAQVKQQPQIVYQQPVYVNNQPVSPVAQQTQNAEVINTNLSSGQVVTMP